MSNYARETNVTPRIIVLDESGCDGSWAESEEGKKRIVEIKELLKDKHFDGYINPELTSTNLTYIPKKYLTWEDLEFTEENQTIEVLLNGASYNIYFYKFFEQDEVNISTKGINIVTLNSYYQADIQFFNDLHLEKVE